MRQKVCATFLTAAIFLLFGQAAWAHNSIVTTYPVKGVETDRNVSDVSIIFNANIEKVRSFVVQNKASGDDITHSKRVVDGKTMTLYYKEPLKPGTYRVVYDVVGADGHLVHGTYNFTVLDPSKTDDKNEQQKAQEPNQNQKTEPQNETKKSNELTKAEKTEQDFERNMPIFIVLLIGLGAVAGLGLFLAFRKNKA